MENVSGNENVVRKILATKSGWLIGVYVKRETAKAHVVQSWDEDRERRVLKNSVSQKLFDTTDDAQLWIRG